MLFEMVVVGFALDLVLGDPPRWPHPVKLMGHMISMLTKWFNRPQFNSRTRFLLGMLTWLIVVGLSWLVTFIIFWVVNPWPVVTFIIGSYLSYTCLSIRGLAVEGHKIMASLQAENLPKARKQVGMIVGRDTEDLTSEAVCKATIETIAENTSDGVIAPLLFLMIFGPIGGVVYKAVNTLDSMIGYRNEKYRAFGACSARIDDVFNYLPARITWGLLILSSWLLQYDFRAALKVGEQDRNQHRSPNSGFSESVVAGALHLRLGGPHYYFGELVTKPYIGQSFTEAATINDIQRTINLLYITAFSGLVIFMALRIAWL